MIKRTKKNPLAPVRRPRDYKGNIIKKVPKDFTELEIRKKRYSRIQLIHQEKFRLITRLLNPIAPHLRKCFPRIPGTGFKKAFSANYKNIFEETTDGVKIDFEKIMLSAGILNSTPVAAINQYGPRRLIFFWLHTMGNGAHEKDKAFIAVYCEELHQWVYRYEIAERSDKSCSVDLPPFSGKSVHAWLGFFSADKKTISNSVYAGTVKLK